MKLLTLSALLLPATAAWELPFALPSGMEELRSALESQYAAYAEQIPSYDALRSAIKFPAFIQQVQDPIAASPLLALHRTLVSTPSVTGSEQAIAKVLADYLVSRNFTVEQQAVGDAAAGRSNVYAYMGANRTARTLLTSHMDTVPPFIPYGAAKNTLTGRGANDAKGSVAAQITAVEELLAAGTLGAGDVALLYVVGEEADGAGMKAASAGLNLSFATAIFGEPTENRLAVGHKGIALLRLAAAGKASHSGYPELGVNANSHLIAAMAILDALPLPGSPVLGNTTLNIGRLEGGVAANVISAHASADIAVRVAGDRAETMQLIRESIAHLPVTLEESTNGYGPVELDHDVEGFETVVCNYGTDVPNLEGGQRKFLYGPGSILTAHGDNEYVLKSDLYEAVAGYKKLIKESLWPSKPVPAVVGAMPAREQDAEVPPVAVGEDAVIVDIDGAARTETVVAKKPVEVVAENEGSPDEL